MFYVYFFCFRIRPPTRSTLTDTLFPFTTRFRSDLEVDLQLVLGADGRRLALGRQDAVRLRLADRGRLAAGAEEARHLRRVLDEVEDVVGRSEEHTSELQSLMRISYAVFCLKKKTNRTVTTSH